MVRRAARLGSSRHPWSDLVIGSTTSVEGRLQTCESDGHWMVLHPRTTSRWIHRSSLAQNDLLDRRIPVERFACFHSAGDDYACERRSPLWERCCGAIPYRFGVLHVKILSNFFLDVRRWGLSSTPSRVALSRRPCRLWARFVLLALDLLFHRWAWHGRGELAWHVC